VGEKTTPLAAETSLTRHREFEHSTVLTQNGVPGSGWDPYEVWRTRILLPRLLERSLGAATISHRTIDKERANSQKR
jgi:hypothetical protein